MLIHPELIIPWEKEPNYDFADRNSRQGEAYLRALHYGLRDPANAVGDIK